MDWLKRSPGSRRMASGLEWRIWRRLPRILVISVALPAALAVLRWWGAGDDESNLIQAERFAYAMAGLVIFALTMVFTVGLGCIIVMIMKGPRYTADPLPVDEAQRERLSSQRGRPADH